MSTSVEKMRINNLKKGFIVPIIIAIFAVLAIGGTVYFTDHKKVEAPIIIDTNLSIQVSTTTPDISSWETYRSEKYGFEFKYPRGWNLLDDGSIVFLQSPERKKIFDTKPDSSIPISDISLSVHPSGYKDGEPREQMQFNGQRALLLKNQDGDGAVYDSILISGDMYTYNISVELPRSIIESDILSTFKIVAIKKQSGIITSLYTKSGKNYIDIDYIEINQNWEPGVYGSSAYSNVNNQIRTFEIRDDAKFKLNYQDATFQEFQKVFNSGRYETYNPWDIWISNGRVIEIDEHFVS